MNKILSFITLHLIIFCLTSTYASGQDFTDSGIILPGTSYSSVRWGDYDNDGDLDILMSGSGMAKILRNDGGAFTDIGATLSGGGRGECQWGDYDNDGDLDVLITGSGTFIYRNDGGVFTDISAGLPQVYSSSAAWGDYDNDGDLDIVLTGNDNTLGIGTAMIFRNDNGTFNNINAPIQGITYGTAEWGDYDKDGDLDLVITGYTNNYTRISRIYTNDNGIFKEYNAGLPGLYYSNASFSDYDKDGDLDLFLSGSAGSKYISGLFKNDNGVFTNTGADIPGFMNGSSSWGDYDGDGDPDLLVSGNSMFGMVAKVYRNDSGIFTDIKANLPGITYGSAVWGDYDNDGDLDILLSGNGFTRIFTNNSANHNTPPAPPSGLTSAAANNGMSLSWNKSTDTQTSQDGLTYNIYIGTISGAVNKRTPMAVIPGGYRKIPEQGYIKGNSWIIKKLPAGIYYWSVQAIDNSDAGSAFATQATFTVPFSSSVSPSADQNLSAGQNGAVLTVTESTPATSRQWKYSKTDGGPYDQVITGATGLSWTPVLPANGTCYVICESVKGGVAYISNQVKITASDFIENTAAALPALQNSSLAWGDYDNDNDLDLFISGHSTVDGDMSRIYRNDNGAFTNTGIVFPPYGPGYWGDYNNDGDLDIAVLSPTGTRIYDNNNGSFTEKASLPGVSGGAGAWGDFDNDGDLDFLLTGTISNGNLISKLYRNDKGVFSETGVELTGITNGSVSWGDYDNDGDADILITGLSYYIGDVSLLYRNDNGIFTPVTTNLYGAGNSSAAFGDYDNDGDLDILIAGGFYTYIYRNDGGIFSAINSIPAGLSFASAAWGDFDNDGDLDALVSGKSVNVELTRIYQNNNGEFQPVITSMPGVYSGCVAWADYDNDGDLDLAVTGISSSGPVSKIYRNSQAAANVAPASPGNLSAETDINKVTFRWNKSTDTKTPSDGLSYNIYIGKTSGTADAIHSTSAIPGGFRRIVARGNQTNSFYIENLPKGTYFWSVQAVDQSFAGSSFAAENSFTVNYSSSISPVADQNVVINQMGTVLFVTESDMPVSRQWKYSLASGGPYDKVIAGATGQSYYPQFTEWGTYFVVCESMKDGVAYTSNEVKVNVSLFSKSNSGEIPGIYRGRIKFGDYDNDGDLDILADRVYRNDSGHFTDAGTPVYVSSSASAAWGDYDNDGDLDILVNSGSVLIFTNTAGVFTQNPGSYIGGINGSAAWGDYDNDGDLDFVVTGGGYTRIYTNNSGTFTELNAQLTGVTNGSSSWGDYDSDGDLDLLITGNTSAGPVSKIYRNDGGKFTAVSASLTGVYWGDGIWGDYDNDGDLDILLTGITSTSSVWVSKIYRNDNGVFPDMNAGLPGLRYSSTAFGDYDNDGDLDLVLNGMNNAYEAVTSVYRNENGVFTAIGEGLEGISYGSSAWGDIDNDGDLDLVLTGEENSGVSTFFYKNNIQTVNSAPTIPSNLQSVQGNNKVNLSWTKSNDTKTLQAGISYNIYIGTASNTANKKSPMSSVPSGYRRIVQKELQGSSWTVKNLPAGTYYWSVQAIDNTFAASPFQAESSFNVPFSSSVSPSADQVNGSGQLGSLLTVTESALPSSRQWKYSLTSGGPYNQIVTGATSTTYTPQFAPFGTYYIVCESVYGGITYTTNEVKVRVPVFTENFSLQGVSAGALTWGDIDNDGDLDLYVSGSSSSRIYRNTGGTFSDIIAGLPLLSFSSAAWGDYDNDNDLDLLIAGSTSSGIITKIYKNEAGIFTELKADLPGIRDGSVSWCDFDNDGDADILLCGNSITKLYANNNGIFSEVPTSFPGVTLSSAAWGDYDNDGDQDLIIAGAIGSDNITGIFRNDNGMFTDINAGLTGVSKASVAWGDYDSDGDLDILVSGNTATDPVTIVYKNTAGTFTDISAGLPGVYSGSVAWGDYDNDGDLDILLSGNTTAGELTRIYRNDSGIFKDTGELLPGVQASSACWGDFDGDRDLDIALSGSGYAAIAKIYKNNITSVNSAPSAPSNLQAEILANKVKLTWAKSTDSGTAQEALTYNLYIGTAAGSVNRNSPLSALPGGLRKISQRGNSGNSFSIKNLPAGTYYWSVQAIDNSFSGSSFSGESSFTVDYSSSAAPAAPQSLEINKDGTVLTLSESSLADSHQWKYSTVAGGPYNNIISGATGVAYTPRFQTWGTYYVICETVKNGIVYTTNEVLINIPVFLEQKGFDIDGVRLGAAAFGDYDNDGDLDLLIAGVTSPGGYPADNRAKIYRNDNGTFNDISAGLTPVFAGSVSWNDYDRDNDLDVLITGMNTSGNYITKIYRNDSGFFTETDAGLPGTYLGATAWADYDNDGDPDLLITGVLNSNNVYTGLFRNDNGTFTEVSSGLPAVYYSTCAFGDYDNDGDPDLFISGYSNPEGTSFVSAIYRNDNGSFTDLNAGFTGVAAGSAAWGDFDNDGDLDIVITGNTGSGYVSSIFRNDNGVFTDIHAGLPGVNFGSCKWGDYDTDGDIDLLISGQASSGYITSLYSNQNGTFSEINAGLTRMYQGTVGWGDYDNDGDLDIISTGYNLSDFFAKVYKNSSITVNTPPGAPANLRTTGKIPGKIVFAWDKASDTSTPQNTLTYNIRIGTTAGGCEIVSPVASVSSGTRKIPSRGNTELNTVYSVGPLSYGRYFWSVQAIDQNYAGGAWSAESSFTILRSPAATDATNVSQPSFTANWTASTGATGYRIDVATDASFTSLVTGYDNKDAGSGTSIAVTGLNENTTYYYRIRAVCSDGTSINSNTITLKTLIYPPAIPSGLTASSCNDVVSLRWTANTEATFLRYVVYGGAVQNPTNVILSTADGDKTATTATVSAVTHGQTYYFRIKAVVNGDVTSDYSNEVSVKVKTGLVPRVKSKFTNSNSNVLICYNINDSIASFQWYRGSEAIAGATNQYYLTGKVPGSYTVMTTDKDGCKNTSAATSIGSKSLQIFPNPASTGFTVKLNSESTGKTIIAIYNSSGAKIREYQSEKTGTEFLFGVPVLNMPAGKYTIEVKINDKEADYSPVMIIN